MPASMINDIIDACALVKAGTDAPTVRVLGFSAFVRAGRRERPDR